MNDESEFLDGNSEWIHVSISGDSRGYLRRNGVEVPERIASRAGVARGYGRGEKFLGFRMEREETSTFPGNWAPLKGKTVKIYTIQPIFAESEGVRARRAAELFAHTFSRRH